MRHLLCAIFVALLVASPAGAQNTGDRIDVDRLGPQVGEPIPDFRLMDQRGVMKTLADVTGPDGAMIVFSRSVDWCPYCKTQAIELQGRLAELRAEGLNVVLITYDPVAVMADFATRRNITYPLLSDPGSATITRFGILNTASTEPGARDTGIPYPGTFIVNPEGIVTARFFEAAYQERNTVSSILVRLGADQAPAAASRVTTDHLQVTSYATDEVVAPGTLFSLVFDVEPRERMHVYAPGADNYRIIGVNLESNPLLMTRPLEYPDSEIYYFEPLDERVPVYMKPFRLTQGIMVDPAREKRSALADLDAITIEGTLDYQACDDRICFNPRSVPVSFTVRLRSLDTERANVAP